LNHFILKLKDSRPLFCKKKFNLKSDCPIPNKVRNKTLSMTTQYVICVTESEFKARQNDWNTTVLPNQAIESTCKTEKNAT